MAHPLAALALKRGLITKAQMEHAEKQLAAKPGAKMEEILRAMGLPEAVVKRLRDELRNATMETQIDE